MDIYFAAKERNVSMAAGPPGLVVFVLHHREDDPATPVVLAVWGQVSNRVLLPPILQPAHSQRRELAGPTHVMILTKCSSEISVRQQDTRQGHL